MVVKMMKWRPWPPLVTKKYEVKLVVRRLEGWHLVHEGAPEKERCERLTVEIRWRGPKVALGSLRRTVKRNFTKEAQGVGQNGIVSWEDEEFQSRCSLNAYKENVFHPWEIGFYVFSNGLKGGPKNKVPVVGTSFLNLAEYASVSVEKEFELSVPLSLSSGAAGPPPLLCISLGLLELGTARETLGPVQRMLMPVSSPSQQPVEAVSTDQKDEVFAIKASLRKVKMLTEYVSTRRSKKACREEEGSEGGCSTRSDDSENNCRFDSYSSDDGEEGEFDEGKEDPSARNSFSYESLAYANCMGGSFYSSTRINGEDADWVYCSNRRSDVGCSHIEDSTAFVSEPTVSKRSILPWRKRKLSFRSPKAKGEPLLKKAYGEEGGDDIDYDRRQLSSDEAFSPGLHNTELDPSGNRSSSYSEFGNDDFAIGSWEQKEVISRDGHMKLQARVFLASIDQRSERAAGESACTALVAVIADWFQNHHGLMPIKSQLDSLIREGSLEWRNLCEVEDFREKFPDKHFDLETVLQAKVRPLTVVPEKSFIGFFHPDGMEEGRFEFLQGAMSFDNIWDEISRAGKEGCPDDSEEPHVYIVSWNDHFFVLKVEREAYYIIDTLGERLHEGCNQAYMLKFDSNTVIHKLANNEQDGKPSGDLQSAGKDVEPKNQRVNEEGSEESIKNGERDEEIVSKGKEACKEYIKNFLAAIPLRELQADIKKGLASSSTPVHHRLQIEFHYTRLVQPPNELSSENNMKSSMAVSAEVPITDIVCIESKDVNRSQV